MSIEPPPFMTDDELRDAARALRRPSRKHTPSVLPFTIVIDTREQTPLTFPENVPTMRTTLHTGDYSIEGHENEFTIERKSLADAVHTVIHERARFERELDRMRTFSFRRIVVTCPFSRVLRGKYEHSRANPNSVIGLLRSLEVRYDVPITFADDGAQAARHVVDWARFYMREREKRNGTPPPALGPFQGVDPLHPTRDDSQLSPIPPIPHYEQQRTITRGEMPPPIGCGRA